MEVNVLNCLLRKINSLHGHTYIEEICGQYFKLGFYLDGGGFCWLIYPLISIYVTFKQHWTIPCQNTPTSLGIFTGKKVLLD